MTKIITGKLREMQKDQHLSELVKGSFVAFVLKLSAAIFTFALNVVLAQKLGPEGSGDFFLALTVVLICASIGCIGMEQALVRFVASSVATGHIDRVLGVYQKAMLYALVVTVSISASLFFLSPWISQVVFVKPEIAKTLAIMSLAVSPVALFTLHSFALQGLKKIAASILVQSIVVPSIVSCAALFLIKDFGITAVAWSYVLAALISLILGRWLWKNAVSLLEFGVASFDRGELLSCSRPLFGVVLMSLVITWLPMLLLGVWGTSENVGIYSAASRTAALTSFVLVAVNSIMAPRFAALSQQGDLERLSVVVKQSTKYLTLLALPIWGLFLVFPELILSIFGEQFKQGSIALMIIATGQFFNVATGLVGSLLMMSGHGKLVRNNLVFTGFMGVLLSIWLIPSYGVIGAAISTALMILIQNFISVIQVRKRLDIMIFSWVSVTFLKIKS